MPIAADDKERLPPLTPYDEVAERQRLADMKAFRQNLVETGSAKVLVQLYQHIAKNEMRLDNPDIIRKFLAKHTKDLETPEVRELSEENADLNSRRDVLQAQVDDLARELDQQQRLKVGKTLFRHLVAADFWGDELRDDDRAEGLPVRLLYRRLCGQKVDKATGKIFVNLMRPSSHTDTELMGAAPMPLARFSAWVARDIPEDLHVWCRDVLLPKLSAVRAPKDPPYERELLQAIRATGFYPDNLDDVAYKDSGKQVCLEPNLIAFLDAAAAAAIVKS